MPSSAMAMAGSKTWDQGSTPCSAWAASAAAMKPGTRAVRPLGSVSGMLMGSVSPTKVP